MLQVLVVIFLVFVMKIGCSMKRRLYKQGRKVRGKTRRRRSRKGSSEVSLDKKKLRRWSLEIRKLDGYVCIACNKNRKQMHAHHVVSKNFRPQYAYEIGNGITLCKACHMGRGGVHSKDVPRNIIISNLRKIFWKKNIKVARLYVRKLRGERS